MSELKHQLMLNKDRSWVPCYLKSEADKVIAEKDKELRHHKYKRCLANAEICCEKKYNCYNRALRKYNKNEADYLVRKSNFWQDCEFLWLKIAEKFKPNKEAK